MRIHATINERTARRPFTKHLKGRTSLTVIDRDLLQFGLKAAKNRTKTYIVRALHPVGAPKSILGAVGEMTVAEAREKVRTPEQ